MRFGSGGTIWRHPSFGPLFNPSLWDVHERPLAGISHTSNYAKGWHSAFGSQVDGAHPVIYKFVDELVKERKNIVTKVDHFRAKEVN